MYRHHILAIPTTIFGAAQRHRAPRGRHIQSSRHGEPDESRLRGRPDDRDAVILPLEPCLATQRDNFEQAHELGVCVCDAGNRSVAMPDRSISDLVPLAAAHDGSRSHLVFGQGTGLVETDHVHCRQSFDRVETTHEHFAPPHLLDAYREDCGCQGWQPLGDGSHARATAALSICRKPTPRKRPIRNTAAQTALLSRKFGKLHGSSPAARCQ